MPCGKVCQVAKCCFEELHTGFTGDEDSWDVTFDESCNIIARTARRVAIVVGATDSEVKVSIIKHEGQGIEVTIISLWIRSHNTPRSAVYYTLCKVEV
jgi:hypothetical protein